MGVHEHSCKCSTKNVLLDFENYILVILICKFIENLIFFFAFQGFKKKKAYIATQGISHFLFLQMQCSYVVFLYQLLSLPTVFTVISN